MRIAAAFLTVAVASAVLTAQQAAPMNALSAAERKNGWILLFDGKTLDGWTVVGGVKWVVSDGALSAEPALQKITPVGDAKQTWPQGFLRSTASFGNFEMTAEFWSLEDSNSGLFIRCQTPANPNSLGSCYEINISDPHATTPTGGIVGVSSPLPKRPKTAGRWSRFDVLAEGTHLVVSIDGEKWTDANDDKFPSGAIGLQAGGPTGSGPIKFRNLKIRPTKP